MNPAQVFIEDGHSRGVTFNFGFWIEEKGDHGGFFNPKSEIQNPK